MLLAGRDLDYIFLPRVCGSHVAPSQAFLALVYASAGKDRRLAWGGGWNPQSDPCEIGYVFIAMIMALLAIICRVCLNLNGWSGWYFPHGCFRWGSCIVCFPVGCVQKHSLSFLALGRTAGEAHGV